MMRLLIYTNFCTALALIFLSFSVQAGLFDDLSRGLQDGIKKTVQDAVTGNASGSDEEDDDEFADTGSSSNSPSNVSTRKGPQSGGLTVTALMSNQISISNVGGFFRGGQFGARSNDYGLIISPWKPQFPAGMNRCTSFVYEQFSQLRNDPNLKSLLNQYSSKRGQNIVLENVRVAQGNRVCVYSKLRFVSAPVNPGKFSANTQNNQVTGVVRGLGYGIRRVNIPKKNKPNSRNIPVVHIMLSQTRTSGFDAKHCKVYYSALEEERVVAAPRAIKQLRPNVSRVTLKDVYMLDQLKGHCVFDHYKSFGIPRVNQVAAQAEAEAKQSGAYSFKYHLPQITAVMKARGRDAITASFNQLKQYGYGVTNGRSHISAKGQVRQNWLLVKYDNKNRPTELTSNTLIQKTGGGCETKSNAYVNVLVKRFDLKPVKKNNRGQVIRAVKGSQTGKFGYGRHDCSVSFTADIRAVTDAAPTSIPEFAVNKRYIGFKVDVVQLCADAAETIKALKAAGYRNIGYAKVPKSGLISRTNRRTSQYTHSFRSIKWYKGKIAGFTYSADGEDAYDNLFAKEKLRFEKVTGRKFECRKDNKHHHCLYRDRETQTNYALNAALHKKDTFAINATSSCK